MDAGVGVCLRPRVAAGFVRLSAAYEAQGRHAHVVRACFLVSERMLPCSSVNIHNEIPGNGSYIIICVCVVLRVLNLLGAYIYMKQDRFLEIILVAPALVVNQCSN